MKEINFKKVHEMQEMLHDCESDLEAIKTVALFFFAYWIRKDTSNELGTEIINLYEYVKDLSKFLMEREEKEHEHK